MVCRGEENSSQNGSLSLLLAIKSILCRQQFKKQRTMALDYESKQRVNLLWIFPQKRHYYLM